MPRKTITVYSRDIARVAAKGLCIGVLTAGVGVTPALADWYELDVDPAAAKYFAQAFGTTTATSLSAAYHEIDVGLGAKIVFDEDSHQSERYGPRRGVIIGRFS